MKKQGLPVREPSKRKHGPCLVAPHFLIHLQTVVCVCVCVCVGGDFNGHFVSVFAPLLRVMVEDSCCTAWISKSFPEPRSQTQPFAKAVYLEETGRSLSFVSQVFFILFLGEMEEITASQTKSGPPSPPKTPTCWSSQNCRSWNSEEETVCVARTLGLLLLNWMMLP